MMAVYKDIDKYKDIIKSGTLMQYLWGIINELDRVIKVTQ